MLIGTKEAASLLGICCQRVRQLLKQGRIIGAQKNGRFWEIPVENGMPQIIGATKGPEGKWRKRMRKALTIIHIDSRKLKSNREKQEKEPIIIVREGSRPPAHCHEIEINGPSRLVYRPNHPISSGAVLWIEVEPNIHVNKKVFTQVACC